MSLEIPGRVKFSTGNGGLLKVIVTSDWSTAEIYLHGAHVTHFQKNGEPPVLFMSQKSRFQQDSPIRGGIPIILPWFGSREGHPAHGFARLQEWELSKASENNGTVKVHFTMPNCPAAAEFPPFAVEFVVTVGQSLTCALLITNESQQNFTFEDCLHTYFQIGDINQISVTGLKGAAYLDQMENFVRKEETNDGIRITCETDRIYLDTESTVEIRDEKLNRRIRIAKSDSRSTVLWNPWIEKSIRMPDFGDDEFHQMVCVESCNVAENKRTLTPGQTSSLRIDLSTAALQFQNVMKSVAQLNPELAASLRESLKQEQVSSETTAAIDEGGLDVVDVLVADEDFDRACDVAEKWDAARQAEREKQSTRKCDQCGSKQLETVPHETLEMVLRCKACGTLMPL